MHPRSHILHRTFSKSYTLTTASVAERSSQKGTGTTLKSNTIELFRGWVSLMSSLSITSDGERCQSYYKLNIHIYIYIHLKVSYETDTVSRSRSFLFPQLCLCSVNFTCNPQVCFGSSLCDMYIAPDQFHHWSAAWQPRLEPALQESPIP